MFYLSTAWIVLWLQILLDRTLGSSLIPIQLILILVLYFGLAKGPLVGEIFGFILGIFIDASSAGILGLHSILYALIGYGAGIFRRQLDESKAWTQGIFTGIISAGYILAYAGIERVFANDYSSLGKIAITLPLTNGLAAPVVFWILDQWFDVWGFSAEHH